jgi:hypothetical protein
LQYIQYCTPALNIPYPADKIQQTQHRTRAEILRLNLPTLYNIEEHNQMKTVEKMNTDKSISKDH